MAFRKEIQKGSLRGMAAHAVMGLNVCVILFMLLFSMALLLFSASESPSLFGYQAVLQAPSRFDESGGADCLLVYRPPADGQLPAVGQRILLRGEAGELMIGAVRTADGGTIIYETDSGREDSLPADSQGYLGTVSVESTFWGHIFAVVAAPENVPITYTSIAIAFLLCILLLALIYAVTAQPGKQPAKLLLPEYPEVAHDLSDDEGQEPVLQPLRSSGMQGKPLWESSTRRKAIPAALRNPAPDSRISHHTEPAASDAEGGEVPEIILGEEPLEIPLPRGGNGNSPRPAFWEKADPETQVVIHAHLQSAPDEPEDEPPATPPSLAELLDEIERQFRTGLTGEKEEEKETI